MQAQVTKYKGKQVLSLPTGKAYHFSFGANKAKLIIEHLDAIYEFAGIPKPNGKKHKTKVVELGCWYCGNGHKQTEHGDAYHPYILCDGCKASIVDKVSNRKFARNRLGGIKVSWGR